MSDSAKLFHELNTVGAFDKNDTQFWKIAKLYKVYFVSWVYDEIIHYVTSKLQQYIC